MRGLAATLIHRRGAMSKGAWRRLPALLLALLICTPARAQSAPIHTIYVAPFQGKNGASDLRAKVVDRLRASGRVQLVDSPAAAEAILRGTGELWVKGYLSASPHDPSGLREAVYGGYLSLELQRPSGEVLWSYLVTPGHLHWKSAGDDMADHIAHRLLAVLAQRDAPGAAVGAPGGAQLTLSGAGSTFAAPLYQDWIESFEARHPLIHTGYQAVGSEEGIRLLREGKTDFAASDLPLSDAEMISQNLHVRHFATVLGAVVPAYNLAGLGRDLRFTPEALAAIYLGKITRWNAPELRALNHGVSLPDQPIVVVHRSDGSGTTATFTAFLSATSADWKSSVGSGMRVAWPTGDSVQGNDGVAAKVAATPGSIGYMELTWAIRNQLSYGMVRNADGVFVQANLTTLSAAAAKIRPATDLRVSLVEAPGHDAWPITTFTWILVPASADNSQKTAALYDLLRWMLTVGQKECSGLGYLALPKEIADRELREASASDNAAVPARQPEAR